MVSTPAHPPALVAAQSEVKWQVCFAYLLLPWLNPFAPGPSSWVGPWLLSAACAAFAFSTCRQRTPHVAQTLTIAGFGAWGLIRTGWSPETLALGGACLLVWMMASLAAGLPQRPGLIRAVALSWLMAALV